ncbi:MAG: EamA family transporter [Archaeoglobaceae archaeon]
MRGEAAIALSAILMSTVSIFVREIDGDALSVAFLRFASASVFLAAFAAVARIRLRMSKILFLLALLNLATVSCYIYAIKSLEVATAALLLYAAPVYAVPIAAAMGEKIELRSVLSLLIGLLGLYLLLSPYPRFETSLLIGVASGVFYALVFAVSKVARKNHEPLEISIANVTIGAALLLPYYVTNPASGSLATVVALGLVPTAIPFSLFAYAMKYLKVQKAPLIALVEPVSATFIGYVYFGEMLSEVQLFGAALVLLSAAVSSR